MMKPAEPSPNERPFGWLEEQVGLKEFEVYEPILVKHHEEPDRGPGEIAQ